MIENTLENILELNSLQERKRVSMTIFAEKNNSIKNSLKD